MPPRDNPTARQVRLGTELRKLREAAGRTAREAAGMLSVDQAKISHIEAGRIGVSEDRVRRLCTYYECAAPELVEALCGIARERRGALWFDEYRGILAPSFLDIAELEHHAVELRSVQALTMPGLAQTENYARTLYRSAIPPLPPDEIEARVEFRMRRARILHTDAPTPCTMLIHEAALRMRFGGRDVTREQLDHLAELSTLPHIVVRVIPFSTTEFIEATQPTLLARGVIPQLDTVQIDATFGGRLLDAPADLGRYPALIDVAEKASLPPDESRHLIRYIAREL
ncbi:helix-turn-helix domain-containing protein [Streptomyces sp. NPDC088923]|uniref:helix-turn-helix domain-containing protein n=1 Tax=Streptomyces sp. NPDC088923 TaxID=3365913 RepID=UPI00380D4B9F